MKTIYLHIGAHRTGSTSIQRFLAKAEDALAKQGIIYPETGRPDTDWSNQYGHHVLHWSLVGKHGIDGDQVWSDLQKEIECREGDRVVLSAEGFEWEGEISKNQIQQQVDAYLNPYPLHIIVYLRPPLSFLRSVYRKRVAMGTWSGSFTSLVETMVPRCDYEALVSRWERVNGVRSVNIRLFKKTKHRPGLETDFMNAIGASFEGLKRFVDSPINTSPSEEIVQVVRWINKLEHVSLGSVGRTFVHRARQNILGQRLPGKYVVAIMAPFVNQTIATEEAAAVLREALGERHRYFLKKRIQPEDRKYLELC